MSRRALVAVLLAGCSVFPETAGDGAGGADAQASGGQGGAGGQGNHAGEGASGGVAAGAAGGAAGGGAGGAAGDAAAGGSPGGSGGAAAAGGGGSGGSGGAAGAAGAGGGAGGTGGAGGSDAGTCTIGPCPYRYRRSLTIDRSKVGLPGAPVSLAGHVILVARTDAALRSVSSGGKVESEGGWDIVFAAMDPATCAGASPCLLPHEIERYDPVAGTLIAWVRVPALATLAASADTVLYAYYGAAGLLAPTQDPASVWQPGWAAVYHMSGDPGGAAPQVGDSTANGNHASSSGGMTTASQVPGVAGGAMQLDGVDDALLAPHSPSLTIPGPVTLSAWVRMGGAAYAPSLVAFCGAGEGAEQNYLYSLSFYPPGPNRLWEFHERAAGVNVSVYSSSPISGALYGVWHQFAVARDVVQKLMRFYADGVPLGAPVSYTQEAEDGSAATLYIGRDWEPPGSGFFLDGAIDEVRIATRVRSAHEIATDFANQSSLATFYREGPEESDPPQP